MSLFGELKRRNVLRVGAAYVVTSWLLIQVAETIFPLFGFDDTPARVVVIVLAIGLIPAVVFAWVFELTPEGLKKETDVDPSQSITSHAGKKLDFMIMMVLALALGYFAVDKFVLDPHREAAREEQVTEQVEVARQQGRTEALIESYGDKSIAVLPFVNMSADEEQEYFSDGLAEELLNLLAKIPELRVISRSSAFSFKGKDLELPVIAERLNVAHILEGSVRTDGNRVRITVQLIAASTDTHLWSETYDRTINDIFAVQDDIATMVVEQLKLRLLSAVPHAQAVEPKAWTLYQQARHASNQLTPEGTQRAIELHRQALTIDPRHAAGWTALASTYVNAANFGVLSLAKGYQLARETAQQALLVDPNYGTAYAKLSSVASDYDRDLAAAARYLQRGFELDPTGDSIISAAASLLFQLGRLDDSTEMYHYALSRDPLAVASHHNLAVNLLYGGSYEDAVSWAQAALQLQPGMIGAHYIISTARLLQGDGQAALDAASAEPYEPLRLIARSTALHTLGAAEEGDAALTELIDKYAEEWPYNIAYTVAWRGDTEQAFDWLERAVAYGDSGLSEIVVQPLFAGLHDDPRWLALLERLGYAPAQLAAIEFEVTLPR